MAAAPSYYPLKIRDIVGPTTFFSRYARVAKNAIFSRFLLKNYVEQHFFWKIVKFFKKIN